MTTPAQVFDYDMMVTALMVCRSLPDFRPTRLASRPASGRFDRLKEVALAYAFALKIAGLGASA